MGWSCFRVGAIGRRVRPSSPSPPHPLVVVAGRPLVAPLHEHTDNGECAQMATNSSSDGVCASSCAACGACRGVLLAKRDSFCWSPLGAAVGHGRPRSCQAESTPCALAYSLCACLVTGLFCSSSSSSASQFRSFPLSPCTPPARATRCRWRCGPQKRRDDRSQLRSSFDVGSHLTCSLLPLSLLSFFPRAQPFSDPRPAGVSRHLVEVVGWLQRHSSRARRLSARGQGAPPQGQHGTRHARTTKRDDAGRDANCVELSTPSTDALVHLWRAACTTLHQTHHTT